MRSLADAIQDAISRLDDAGEATLLEAGKLGEETAQNTSLFRNTGPLRDATKFHQIDNVSGFVLADKAYAIFLEEGNNAGGEFIYPTRAKALHFKINGQDVFAKKVRSHGPLPFMAKAEDKVRAEIESIWNRNLDKAFK